MLRRLEKIGNSGATAAEFALILPVFLGMMLGAIQVGILFFNTTSLQNAVGEGAREATLFPRRSDEQISARITETAFGLQPDRLTTPAIVRGSTGGRDFVDITVNYRYELNFGVYSMPAGTLSQTRRAYLP